MLRSVVVVGLSILATLVPPAAVVASPGGRTVFELGRERRITSLVAADLDGDELPELVLFDASNALLLIERIPAAGDALEEIARVPVGFDTASLIAVDVDGDDRVDLVTASEGSLNLRIDFGDGAGGVEETRELALPGAVKGLAVADFDGDAALDVATAGGSSAQVFVHRALGDREYARSAPIPTPFPQPHTIAAGDFDGDGDPDLAVGGKDDGDEPAYFVVFANRGGAFSEPIVPVLPDVLAGVGVGREGLVAEDFDRDGRHELVFAPERGETLYQIDVAEDGAYVAEAAGSLAEGLGRLRVSDLDGDGWLDVLGVVPDLGTVYVFRNVADATFGFEPACIVQPSAPAFDVAARALAAGALPSLFLAENNTVEVVAEPVADCRDADGCAGRQGCFLVTATPSDLPFTRLAVLRRGAGEARPGGLLVVDDGSLRFLAAGESGALEESWRMRSFAVTGGVATGDFDRDGRADFVLSDLGSGNVDVFLDAVGDSPPAEPERIAVGLVPGATGAADLDGDELLDVACVLRGEGRLAILLGRGDGRFASPRYAPCGPGPHGLALGDLDDDGDADAAVLGDGSVVRILRNAGDAGFAPPEELPFAAIAVAAGDLDGTPPAELALLAEDALTVVPFTGERPAAPVTTRLSGAVAMALGDVDGDGDDDVIVAERSGVLRVLRLGASGLEPLDAPLSLCAREAALLAVGDADDDARADAFIGLPEAAGLRRFQFQDCPVTEVFRRGDVDETGGANLTDAVAILNALFLSGAPPRCPDAADVDDDGTVNLTDGVNLLNFLFLGGPPPPAPGAEECGSDPSADALAACEPPCR